MTTRTKILIAAVLTTLLFPLAHAQEQPDSNTPAADPPVAVPATSTATATPQPAPVAVPTDGADHHAEESKRFVTRTATVTLRSFAPQKTMETVVSELEALGAYVQSSETGMVNLRIPAPQLDAAIAALKGLGDVVDEQMSSEDVSLEVVQLKARIREIENGRNRLISMLNKAEDVQAMLDVQKELNTVTQNLENQQGRLRYLTKRVGESPVVVHVSMKARPKVERMPAHRRPHNWVQGYGIESLFR